jgi:hypothetical protein
MPISEIRVGDWEVFDSGAVTLFEDDALEFTLEHEGDDEAMRLVFEFVEDGGEPRMDPGDIDPAGAATLNVYNHAGGDNVGPADPFNIGVIAGRALHLLYYVDTIHEGEPSTLRFSYTFYLGKAVDEAELGE